MCNLRCTQSTYDLRYEKKTSDANDFGVLRRAAKSSSVTVAIRRKPRRAMGKTRVSSTCAANAIFSPIFASCSACAGTGSVTRNG